MSGRTARDHSHSRRDNKHDHFQQQQYNYQHSYQRHHHSSSSSSASRFDERKSIHGKTPPSRHLWVGNLSNHITQSILGDEFSRFGGLENVAFIPGRSYAFVNFVREDDAIDALNTLQGFCLAGMPLRIEFAKSDKSSAPLRDELHLQHRDELQPRNRSSAISPRESRKRHASPEAYYPDSPRTNERGSDQPTEILWIGFPSCLKVDESILRKAFSPFGDIDKITAFPGRTYAFVQFRNLASACRAKETLQGKLFGNPRVHISFARKDHASSSSGRRNMRHNAPSSPQFKSFQGSSDNLRTNRNIREAGNPSTRAPHLPNMEYGDPNVMNINRLESTWTHTSGPYEEREVNDHWPDVGPPQRQLGYCRSPFREGMDHSHDFSPKFRRQSSFPEYPSNLEDTRIYHGGKKLKIDSFPHEELPEYPLQAVEQHNHVFPGFVPEYSLSNESRPPIPHRGLLEKPSNLNQSLGEKHDIWRSSHGIPQSPPPLASLSLPVERKRTDMELHQPGKKEWNWEGTIAKGGTPVCQARCFPVGKVMDFFLPEFLDCTARTGLDMLAKHYYQAACSWVVFFVAASDADMGYYNEFMYYLGKKERAAVAKLDDRNTLFLVPPSDFSQNVLKIPGKLSISGVVLSLEPSSPGLASLPQDNEMKDRDLVYSHVDRSYSKLQIPLGPSHMPAPYPNLEKSGVSSASIQTNIKTSAPSLFPSYGQGSRNIPCHIENRHEVQTSHPAPRDATSHAFPVPQGYNNSNSGRGGPEFSRANNDDGTSYSVNISRSSSALPLPLGGLQQEQRTSSDVYRPSGFIGNQHEILSRVPQGYNNAPQTADQFLDMLQSSFSQLQQQQVQAENAQAYSHAAIGGTQGSQEIVNMVDAQDDGEADPQKRLQATLQLAATLLQQIQQGKAP